METWRQLLYPLGLLSGIAFSSRFLLQWIVSEKAHQSIVTKTFWKISLFGNLTLLLHAFIQLQFHICFVQVCNAVISWRNLDLMQPIERRWKLTWVIFLLVSSVVATTTLFAWQLYAFEAPSATWFRTPIAFWVNPNQGVTSYLWHAIGIAGLLLFNSRFWVQWWGAERRGESYLGPAFWWMSLAGAFLCTAYFLKIYDLVNIMGPLFGIVPTVRNLMILRAARLNSCNTLPKLQK